jgi:hypothetical protein
LISPVFFKSCNTRVNSDWPKLCRFSLQLWSTGYAKRSLVEMAIEKDEKTAVAWLKEQAK